MGKSRKKRNTLLVTAKPKTTLLILFWTNQRHRSRQILKGNSKALIGSLLSEMCTNCDAADPVHRTLE